MSDQLPLFPESDAISVPRKPWPVAKPLGDAVDAEPAIARPAFDTPALFDLDPQ